MKKAIVILACALITGLSVNAQQLSQYTMFMFNRQMINPAYVGSRDAISITGLFRRQWTGIEGSPTSYNIGVHSPIGLQKDFPRVGLGLLVSSDKIGIERVISVMSQYAYRIPVGEKSVLQLGLQLGFFNYKADFSKLDPRDPIGNDPLINMDVRNLYLPAMGAGAYLYGERYYVGFSTSRATQNAADDLGSNADPNEKPTVYRHYWLMGGMVFPITDVFSLKPNVMAKYVINPGVDVRVPFDADFNLMFEFYKRFQFGISYRLEDSFDFILELQATKNLRVGYAYDYTLSGLNQYTKGSHEIMVGLDFGNKIKAYTTPRFIKSF
jgi:type IX secretion system PorP/SprF family membrane protein